MEKFQILTEILKFFNFKLLNFPTLGIIYWGQRADHGMIQ